MKNNLYEAVTEIIKVAKIYVILMAILWAVSIAIVTPETGVGVLTIATFLNIMFNIAKRGRVPWKKRQ